MPGAHNIHNEILAGETGTILTHGPDDLSVALVYPNSYHVGMSSLGFQAIYGLGNERSGVRVERFFHDLPSANSLETGTPLRQFDVIAFSISFELDYLRVVDILERAGVPLLSREREGDEPLLIAGGSAILVNRLPVYDVFDVFAHGAGEELAPRLFDACAAHRGDRPATLEALSALPGIETPARASDDPEDGSAPSPPSPCAIDDLDAHPLQSVVLTEQTVFGGKCLIEISRGCPHRCTFCWAGHNIVPYTIRSARSVIEIVERQRERTRSFGFIAAAVGAHPEIDEICAYCESHDLLVSFSSLRVEDVTESMLRVLVRGGQRAITLAPETGSTRLRKLLGKRIDDEDIFCLVERAVALDMRDVRLYFMVGLPTETDDEAQEIVGFMERLRKRFVDASRPKGRIGTLTANLGIYVPHPATPLARHADPPSESAVAARLKRLNRSLRRLPNTRVIATSMAEAIAQRHLCNGGRETLSLLRTAHAHDGHWRHALREWQAPPDDPAPR